jgi:hypothetical protein
VDLLNFEVSEPKKEANQEVDLMSMLTSDAPPSESLDSNDLLGSLGMQATPQPTPSDLFANLNLSGSKDTSQPPLPASNSASQSQSLFGNLNVQ